jgi:SAM-dependent methyltransferase
LPEGTIARPDNLTRPSQGLTTMVIAHERQGATARSSYLPTLMRLISSYEAPRILELGGGRTPSFQPDELAPNIASYTVNDISAEELALTGPDYQTALFDVTGDVSRFAGQFDVVFSRTLIEHVRDGRKMHRNVLALLRPGGVAFHLAPTLYSPAFVINKLLPESVSRSVLTAFFPHRRSEKPKFPAFYDWCLGNRSKMERMLRDVGYGEVELRNFYGTNYFRKIPCLREIDDAFTRLAAARDWSTFGSFIHIIARKQLESSVGTNHTSRLASHIFV